MKPLTQCHECLKKLVRQTSSLASSDPILRKKAIAAGDKVIDKFFSHGTAPAKIATIFHREIKKITANPDPFSDFKRKEIEQSRRLYEGLKGEITGDLEGLVKFSIKGNILDFFRGDEEIFRDFHSPINLHINHSQLLEKKLVKGKNLLFLADNSGESFFDYPLINFLRDWGINTTYVVKGQPVQNDITLSDLELSGLNFPNVIDNGSDAVGLDLAAAGDDFRRAYNEADIIIAKGMGHFETIREADPRLFYLFKAKCRPVADDIGVPYESYILKNAL